MFKKAKKMTLVAGALAAISFGGSALASAGAAQVGPTGNPAQVKSAGSAGESQKTAAGARTAMANAFSAPDKASDPETADGAEPAGQETNDGTDAKGDTETNDGQSGGADTETNDGQESGSEVQGNDGPGGHADEPATPSANSQE